jgi:hypothetical protein
VAAALRIIVAVCWCRVLKHEDEEEGVVTPLLLAMIIALTADAFNCCGETMVALSSSSLLRSKRERIKMCDE